MKLIRFQGHLLTVTYFLQKNLTNALPTCPSVSTLGLSGLVFVIVQAVIS